MKRIRALPGALQRGGRRLLWPVGIAAVIAWLFFQGRGENLSLTPPPIGGLTDRGTSAPAAVTPAAEPEPDEVVEVDGQQIKTRGALILLNPAMVAPGASVAVAGSGFEAGARVNFTLKRNESDRGRQLDAVLADKGGNVGGVNVAIPEEWNGGAFLVIAAQADGKRKSPAEGKIQPAAPEVKLADQVGRAIAC